MNIYTFLEHLEKNDSKVLTDSNQSLQSVQLVSQVKAFSQQLLQAGFVARTPVLVRMSDSVTSVIVALGVLHAGGVVFVGNPYDPTERVSDLVTQFGIGWLFADRPTVLTVQAQLVNEFRDSQITPWLDDSVYSYTIDKNATPLERADHSLLYGDVAIFSSGTTGQPKAIVHSFGNLVLNAQSHANAIGLRSSDVVAGFLPIYYSYGLVANLLASLVTGAHFAFQPRSASLDERWANDHGVSVLALTPFFGQRVDVEIPTLRLLTFGGDALSTEAATVLKEKFRGCELYSTYGLTEAGPRVATWRFDQKTMPKSLVVPIGEPLEHCSLELHHKNDDHSAAGELVVSTTTRTLGYYYGVDRGFSMPDWPDNKVFTGDLFFKIDGEFYFASRDKDMIVQNGEKLFPPMIESIIRNIPGVVDARVESRRDPERGQVAVAYLHVSEDVSHKLIRRSLLQKLPHAAIPSEYVFVDQISRSFVGKKIVQSTLASSESALMAV